MQEMMFNLFNFFMSVKSTTLRGFLILFAYFIIVFVYQMLPSSLSVIVTHGLCLFIGILIGGDTKIHKQI